MATESLCFKTAAERRLGLDGGIPERWLELPVGHGNGKSVFQSSR